MKSVPIIRNFDHSDTKNFMGDAHFTDEAITEIHEMLNSGIVMDFAIGFVGEPQEDGTYHKAELVEISMIPRKKESG